MGDAPPTMRRAIGLASLASVVSALPSFLVSGFAIFMADALALGPSELGVAIATFYLGSAVISVPGGRMSRRVGSRRGMMIAGSMTLAALLAIGVGVRTVPTLIAVMAFGGAANGIGQVASNVALAGSVPRERQGLAFGLKQTSAPAATLLSGATIPLIALTVGWRWGFVAGALLALALVAALARTPGLRDVVIGPAVPVMAEQTSTSDEAVSASSPPPRPPRAMEPSPEPALGPLVVIAAGVSCAAAVGMSIVTFYVSSIVQAGADPRAAGYLLMGGSISGIVSRAVLGWSADRRERGHLVAVSALLTFGALGCIALSYAGSAPALLITGTILGFACGWGWPGLFFFAVVKINEGAAARTMSVTQMGMFVGALVGPLTFGRVAASVSFAVAWRGAAIVAVAGAMLLVVGMRLVSRMNPVHIVPARPTTMRPTFDPPQGT